MRVTDVGSYGAPGAEPKCQILVAKQYAPGGICQGTKVCFVLTSENG